MSNSEGLSGSVASAAGSFIGTTISSIAGAVRTHRYIDALLSTSAQRRQTTMSDLVEGREYSEIQWQRAMAEERARAEADWAVESVLTEEEKQIKDEIAAARRGLMHSPRSVSHYGGGRPADNKLWWIIGLGGLGLIVGTTFLISKAGD